MQTYYSVYCGIHKLLEAVAKLGAGNQESSVRSKKPG